MNKKITMISPRRNLIGRSATLFGLSIAAALALGVPASAQTGVTDQYPSDYKKQVIRDIQNLTTPAGKFDDHAGSATTSGETSEERLFDDEMDEETEGESGQPATEDKIDFTAGLLWNQADDHIFLAGIHKKLGDHEHEIAKQWHQLAKETREHALTLTDPNNRAAGLADADGYDQQGNEEDAWGNDDDNRTANEQAAAEQAAEDAQQAQDDADAQQAQWDAQSQQQAADRAAAQEADRIAGQQAAANAAAAQAAADAAAQQQAQNAWNQTPAGSGVAPVDGGTTTNPPATGGGGTNPPPPPPNGGSELTQLAVGQGLDAAGKVLVNTAETTVGRAVGELPGVTTAIDVVNFGQEAQDVVDEGSSQRAGLEAAIDDICDPRSKTRYDGKNNPIWKPMKKNAVRLIKAAPWPKQ